MTPDSPNVESRLFAQNDGSADVLLEAWSLDRSLPNYKIHVTREHGTEITHLVILDTGHFVFRKGGASYLKWNAKDLRLEPGSYVMTVLDGARQVLRKSFNVLTHPENFPVDV